MSFNSYNNKPRLVDKKIIKFHVNKIKNIENESKIQQEDIIKKNIEIKEINNNKWYNKCISYIWAFIKENYGFVTIITLLIVLLYVRYLEVNRRKIKLKKYNSFKDS